ncbi:unnamed protein product, partial [Ectocarpus fasciculatus]
AILGFSRPAVVAAIPVRFIAPASPGRRTNRALLQLNLDIIAAVPALCSPTFAVCLTRAFRGGLSSTATALDVIVVIIIALHALLHAGAFAAPRTSRRPPLTGQTAPAPARGILAATTLLSLLFSI